jgi:hypothetical protein
MITIPASWGILLRTVRDVCPSAVLAGGALRDWDNGRPVKDLDIFIAADGMDEALAAIARLTRAGFEVSFDETGEETAYPEDQNLEVILVADVLNRRPTALPVQLIFTAWDTSQIVERFDYGICRLAYDGERFVRPPEYDEDKAAQVFRLRRDRPTPISMRGSIRRYARLVNSKYAGWDWAAYEAPLGIATSVDDWLAELR